MKKILLFCLSLLLLVQTVYGLNISVNPGESKSISFPQELQSINFSKSSDVSVKTLESGIWKDVGSSTSNYYPLKGYIITNSTGSVLNIEYSYKPNINISNYLIQKDLKAGWNLVGVAQNNTLGERIKSIFGFGYSLPFSQMIDFTSTNFGSTDSGNKLDGVFHTSGKSQANSKYVFESKAYAVFSNVDSLYSGVQNFTDSDGNIVVEDSGNVIEEEEDDNLLNDLLGENETSEVTRILSKGPNLVHLAGTNNNLISYSFIAGKLKDSKIINIEFLIKKYDGNRDENSTADIDFSNIENIKLKLNNTEYITNPIITSSGSDINIVRFKDIDYTFSIDKNFIIDSTDNDEENEDYEVDGENILVASLYADFSDNISPDNFSAVINPKELVVTKQEEIVYNGGQINNRDIQINQSCNNIGNSGGGGGSSSSTYQINSSCVNIYETSSLTVGSTHSNSQKLILGGTKNEDTYTLELDSIHGSTIINGLYFANDHDADNGIDGDISSEIINNIRLDKNGTTVGTGILNNGKLKFENLNIEIDEGKVNSLKIIADFPVIDSDLKTDKKIRFVLTDIKAEGENGKKISNDNLYDGDSEYLLNDDIGKQGISGYRITTRKSTFSIGNNSIGDLVLGDGVKTVYKGEITASGGNIEIAGLDFVFKGFLNGVGLDNLSSSGSSHSKDTVIVDNEGNEVMKDYELFIGGSKVDFLEDTASGTLNERLYVYPTRLKAHFAPISIDNGDTKDIELKVNFANTKENDYFYVTRNKSIIWSDLSAGDEHTNKTNDWFDERDNYISGDNSTYTLTK